MPNDSDLRRGQIRTSASHRRSVCFYYRFQYCNSDKAASKTTGSAFCIIRHYLLPPEQYKVHSIGLCEAGMIPSKPFPSLQLLHIPGAQCISTTKNHLKVWPPVKSPRTGNKIETELSMVHSADYNMSALIIHSKSPPWSHMKSDKLSDDVHLTFRLRI